MPAAEPRLDRLPVVIVRQLLAGRLIRGGVGHEPPRHGDLFHLLRLLRDLFLMCPKLVKPAKQFLEDLVVTFLQANSLVDMAQLQLGLAGSEVEFLEPVGRVADHLAGFVVFLAVAFELSELAEKFGQRGGRFKSKFCERRLNRGQFLFELVLSFLQRRFRRAPRAVDLVQRLGVGDGAAQTVGRRGHLAETGLTGVGRPRTAAVAVTNNKKKVKGVCDGRDIIVIVVYCC